MPFTISHAAAALPGVRRDGTGRGPLVPSALVAGAFAPDVPYFADSAVRGAFGYGEWTHGPWGPVLPDPLVAAALVGMWLFVREPVVTLLPGAWRGRAYAVLCGRSWRGRSVAATAVRFWASAALGALSHVVWDAFTHPGRWGVRLVPGLEATVAGPPAHLVAQYGSSAVALPLIGWWLAGAVRRTPERPSPAGLGIRAGWGRWVAWVLLAGCTVAGAVHRCVRYADALAGRVSLVPADFVPMAPFGAGAGLVAGLVALAAVVRAGSALAGRRRGRAAAAGEGRGQWAADSQSGPTPTETSSGARSG